MKYEALPDEHHVVRLVSHARLRKDEHDNVIGVEYTAFQLKASEEGLSVTWLEYFAADRPAQIVGAVKAIRASNIKPSKKSGFAIGRVSAIKDTCSGTSKRRIRVVHWPEADNMAHCEIRQFPRDDLELLQKLALGCWSELVLNSSVPDGEKVAPEKPFWLQTA